MWAEVSCSQSRIQVATLESLALAEKWFMCPSAWEPSECFTLYRLVRHWSLEMQTRLWYDRHKPYGCFLKWWYPQNTPKWSFLVGKPMVVGDHHFRKPPYASICIMLYDWNPKRKHTKTIIISHNFKDQHFVLHPTSLRLSFHLGDRATGRRFKGLETFALRPGEDHARWYHYLGSCRHQGGKPKSQRASWHPDQGRWVVDGCGKLKMVIASHPPDSARSCWDLWNSVSYKSNALQLIAGGSSNPWIQQHDRNDRRELSEPKALYPLLCRC